MRSALRHLPLALLIFRGAVGPLVVLDALDGRLSGWFGPLVIAALLSDIFDGVIARKLGVATVSLRQADLVADLVCIVGVLLAMAITRFATVAAWWPLWLAPLAIEPVMRYYDQRKFGRPAAHHAWSARWAGIFLACSAIALARDSHPGFWIAVTAVAVVRAQLEHFAITATLPAWRPDVRTVAEARAIRDGLT